MTRWWVAAAVPLLACGGTDRDAPRDGAAGEAQAPVLPVVVLETTRGRLVLELDPARAPVTVDNFVRHVRAGFYDGLVFHRIAPDFVIQTGQVDTLLRRRTSSVFPLPNEADNGVPNVRGAVAMARTADPHSATVEFFVNLKDNAKLDFRDSSATGWGYAVFGRVTEGMEVVDAIAAGGNRPRSRYPEFPADPTTIIRAYVQPADGRT